MLLIHYVVKMSTQMIDDRFCSVPRIQAAQQEALVSNAEASRLERDLAAARTAAMANGVGVKSRLQALQIAYVTFL